MTSIYRALVGSPTPNSISNGVSKSRVTLDSYHSTLSLRDNHDRVFSSRVTPDSYHSTLSLRDNMTVCFLSRATELFSLHYEPLTFTQKFRISPRVSYTHTEIQDSSPGLLHPHRNLGYLPGSLTPTQKFRIAPRVSYTHTEIRDSSPGLLHPHRNSGSLLGSLPPPLKFGISP